MSPARCCCSAVVLVIALLCECHLGFALEPGSCAIAPIKADPKIANAFTAEQEVYLGDILAEYGQVNGVAIENDVLNSYLSLIGVRLVKQLPPTNLSFRFYVADASYANAFSIAGGRVYVTRKLIAFNRSEDELAAVIAHELGHIVTHQQAILFTKVFRQKIGVTSFADRKDLEDGFHRLLESKKSAIAHELDEEQEEADRVGLEILVRAGYRAEAMTEFFDRFTANKGKRGNWFTDFIGVSTVNSKRFRDMLKKEVMLPSACIQQREPNAEQRFSSWQANVIAYDRQNRPESLPGLVSKKQIEPLQDQLHTLRFSPDGKYVLAQDNGMIHVLSRSPLQVKFSISAQEAYPAQFTGDSKYVVFYSPDLRVEVWDIDKEESTATYDVYSAFGCLQTALSRDGRTMACLDNKNELVLIDTTTQERIFEKKNMRTGDVSVDSSHFSYELDFINLLFSPDGKFLICSGKYGSMAVDVVGRKELTLNGTLKSVTRTAFTFLDNRRIFGLADASGQKASLITFPEGRILQTVEFGGSIPSAVSKGEYVLMRPIKDYDVGVFDLGSGHIVRANKKPAMDIWEDVAVSEMGSGEIGLFGSSTIPLARCQLPRARLAAIRALAVSKNFGWLALAEEERGAVWNLSTGQRLYNLKTFHGAYIGEDSAFVDFTKQGKVERIIARVNLQQSGISLASKVGSGRFHQYGPYVLSWRKGDSEKSEKDNEPGMERFNRYRYEGESLKFREVFVPAESNETLEVRDAPTGDILWTRRFDKNVPVIFVNEGADVVTLTWRLYQSGAKSEFEKVPGLATKKSSAKDNDYLLEVVDLHSGRILRGMVFDTNDGVFSLEKVLATANWAAISDSNSRTLVYDLRSGKCTGKIFGNAFSISAASGELAIEYDSRHFSLFDAATMNRQADYVFSDPLIALRFSLSGDRFLAVTNTQTVYQINTFPETVKVSPGNKEAKN